MDSPTLLDLHLYLDIAEMAIYFTSENIKFDLKDKRRVKSWITGIIKSRGKKVGDISYLFCDDAYLIEINRTYLNHDTYTDIITFDYVSGNVVSGDILISIDRVRENAQTFGVAFEHELCRVIVHGVLHLLGQKDKSEQDAKRMRELEDDAIALWNTMD